MPTISMFFGIIVRMYFWPKEHNPPHIHVHYQDDIATFSVESGELLDGKLPKRQIKLVSAWIEIHREELMADWQLCQAGEKPFTIEPLQ